MNQSHICGVLNHYQSIGANDHILSVMAGRCTPKQKEIARKQARLDTELYIDLMTWFFVSSGHSGFEDVTPTKKFPCKNTQMSPRMEVLKMNLDEKHSLSQLTMILLRMLVFTKTMQRLIYLL